MDQLKKTINIPLSSIFFVFKNGLIKPTHLKSLLILKLNYPDVFLVQENFFQEWANLIKCNIKTSKTHFEILIKANYIGFDNLTNKVYIRSIFYAPHNLGTNRFSVIASSSDLANLNAFFIAAIISYKVQVYKQELRRLDLKCDGSLQGLQYKYQKRKYLSGYAPIAVTRLAKILNRSPAWAEKYKKQAMKLGYVKRKADFIETDLPWESRFHYDDNQFGRMRKVNGKLTLVATDLLTSNVSLLKRKKSV